MSINVTSSFVRKLFTNPTYKQLSAEAATATEVTVYQRKTILTDAQIKALPTTPVELVPAPGAGKKILIHAVDLTLKLNGGGSQYGAAAAQSFIQITPSDETLPAIVNGDFALLTSFLNGNGGVQNFTARLRPAAGYFDNTVGIAAITPVNEASFDNVPCTILADNGGVVWTGGNPANTLEVTVFYSIVDL